MNIFECLGTFKENNITLKIIQKITKNYLTFPGKIKRKEDIENIKKTRVISIKSLRIAEL